VAVAQAGFKAAAQLRVEKGAARASMDEVAA
jgi:hypothetical protein